MALSGFNTPITRSQTPLYGNLRSRQQTCNINVLAILSDMDGTLIDSTNAIIKHWERIGETYSIDPKVILATSHGRRSIDVFQTIDPANANWDYVRRMEAEVPILFGNDAEEIPGARQLLSTLELLDLKWAIITSGTRPLVEGWLKVLKLLEPEHMVTAEDVSRGKPDPEPYQQGLGKLGLEAVPNSVLVLEDAPAGVKAGKAAGCKVLGVATTHRAQDLLDAGADWVVPDLRSVNVVKGTSVDAGFEVNLCNAINQ